MEDLAIVVSIIFFGLILIGAIGVLLAILFRKNKVNRYWILGYLALLTILSLIASQGSPILGAIPLGWALVSALIAFWPSSKK
jgi:hypothetical protein